MSIAALTVRCYGPAYAHAALIVDPETTGQTRSAGRFLMVLAIGVLVAGYAGLALFQRADPDISARSRQRLFAALPVAGTATASRIPRAAMLGPSVLAQR